MWWNKPFINEYIIQLNDALRHVAGLQGLKVVDFERILLHLPPSERLRAERDPVHPDRHTILHVMLNLILNDFQQSAGL